MEGYQACVRAFADQRYEPCLAAALPMLASDSDLELLQIVLISLQRLGKMGLAAKVGNDALRITSDRPWEHSLFRITLGQIAWPEVVFQAADSHERCQAYYYASARSLTAGEKDAAIQHLLACQSTRADCLEFELAQRALRLIAPREVPSPEEEAEVDRLRIEYQGVPGEVRVLRPKGSLPLVTSKPQAHLGGWLADVGPPAGQFAELDPGKPRPSSPGLVAEESIPPPRRHFEPVRVFVSSTFRDMHAEREVLVKKVFPQLRKCCADRGLDLIEVDLRWGIPEERSADILPACFGEIDRCQYFVGLLGSRYGSVPDSIHESAIRSYPWLADYRDRSITELEIVHRRVSNPAATRRSFFYFRTGDGADIPIPASQEPGIADQESQPKESLKASIRQSGSPFFENYPSAEAVGEQILKDLIEAIVADYPSDRLQDPLAIERHGHEAIAAAHLRAFIPRQGYTERLDQHVRTSDRPILISGKPGSGKSAFLANWIEHHRAQNPQDIVVEHYVGATAASTDCAGLIRRLCAEVARRYTIPPDLAQHYAISEDEADPGRLLAAFHNHLFLATRLPQQRLIFVLDGLDQVAGSDAPSLWWLPKTFGSNIKVILSARPGALAARVKDRGWAVEEFAEFTAGELSQAAAAYLHQYGKDLGQQLAGLLAAEPQSRDPLYLRVLLNELRVFGGHENLGACLLHYLEAPDLAALYRMVFERWQSDYNQLMHPRLVEEALSCLSCSRNGLTENEWLGLLQAPGQPLARVDWTPLFLELEPHLINRSGRWSFAQEAIRKTVTEALTEGEENRRQLHRRLADYFASAGGTDARFDELPWHLQRGQMWPQLSEYLSDLNVAERFMLEGRGDELLGYWKTLGAAAEMVASYQKVITRAEAEGIGLERLGVYYIYLGDMCVAVSQLGEAECHYRRALSIGSEILEQGHPSIAAVETRLGSLLLRLGRTTEAEERLKAALRAKEDALGPIDFSLCPTLLTLGDVYEARCAWRLAERRHERAFEICRFFKGELHGETASSAVRLAAVLLRGGEKERAEEFCKRALMINTQLPGEDNPVRWQAMEIQAEIHLQRRQLPEAESLYQKILDRRREKLGLDNPSTAMTLCRLGLVTALQGDRAAGSEMCRQALDISRHSVGPNHPVTIEIRKIASAFSAAAGE